MLHKCRLSIYTNNHNLLFLTCAYVVLLSTQESFIILYSVLQSQLTPPPSFSVVDYEMKMYLCHKIVVFF